MDRRSVGQYPRDCLVRCQVQTELCLTAAGISKRGESSRLAVETTLHPISYTVFEGQH